MSNGARHGLGALVGLVATPVVAACLMAGTGRLGRSARLFMIDDGRWPAAAVLLLAAVVLGLVVGSRVSPLASLIPGVVYTFVGLLWLAAPRWAVQNTTGRLPARLGLGYEALAAYGVFLVLGVALVAASLPSSRWRAAVPAGAPRFGGPPPAPVGRPPVHGAPAPVGAPQPPPQPPYVPPAAGQDPPPWPGGAPHDRPPAQSSKPEASFDEAKPSGRDDHDAAGDDPPGDWTQMYGGGSSR
ncbi:MAG TPA: hypothetical protein VIL71_21000 [Spirillospora sp.]